MKGKKGITLLTLIITIVITTLIAGVVIVKSTDIVEQSDITKFGEEIN